MKNVIYFRIYANLSFHDRYGPCTNFSHFLILQPFARIVRQVANILNIFHLFIRYCVRYIFFSLYNYLIMQYDVVVTICFPSLLKEEGIP